MYGKIERRNFDIESRYRENSLRVLQGRSLAWFSGGKNSKSWITDIKISFS